MLLRNQRDKRHKKGQDDNEEKKMEMENDSICSIDRRPHPKRIYTGRRKKKGKKERNPPKIILFLVETEEMRTREQTKENSLQ